MTLDTLLSILGFALSFGSLAAAGWNKQVALVVIAFALMGTTGAVAWVQYKFDSEVAHVEGELKEKLSTNQWTFDMIRAQLNNPDPKVLQAALERAERSGAVDDRLADCRGDYGFVLSTRAYFNVAATSRTN